jgi:hypothetical protein
MRLRFLSVVLIAAIWAAHWGEGARAQRLMVIDHEGGPIKPARLFLGKPEKLRDYVIREIINKMESCWFHGPNAPLRGFQYERGTGEVATSAGYLAVEEISLSEGEAPPAQRLKFSVLVGTSYDRKSSQKLGIEAWTINNGFPPALAGRLDREMRAWDLDRPGCTD